MNVGIHLLHSAVALAALHDSVESFPQPRCHPETRTKMLEDLRRRSQETEPSTRILWLYGPAGAGKSAIMQTLSRQLQDAGRLGGCFFFKRGHTTCGNGNFLLTTIAYQLALGVPWLKAPISQVVEDDPSIIGRSIEAQLQKLILEPCCLHYGNQNPLTIFIDGLDECEGHDVHEEILRAIRRSYSGHPLPLRFIIASRPEPHIRELFESPFYDGGYHPFNVEESFEDVRKYLCDEFERIHREHRTMANIPSPWPSPDVLGKLVSNSSGHFIYAATIIKFIDDKYYRPTERLGVVQEGSDSDSAFDALDQLYMNILSTTPRQSQLSPILCAIANFDLHPDVLDQLLGLDHGEARLLLRGLHSVLHVPSDESEPDDDTVYAHHASFLDFLDDPRRSGTFYVGGLQHRIDLARSFVKLFAGEYQEQFLGDGIFNRSVSIIQNHACLIHHHRSPQGGLIPFITSLPPYAELFSLIQLMNPDYIFAMYPKIGPVLSWLNVSLDLLPVMILT
jgi:hypothetical protein